MEDCLVSKLTDFYPVNGVDTNKVLNQQVFTSSGTWTRPAGVTRVFVSMSGGGGGGGGGSAGGIGGDTSFGTIVATGGAGASSASGAASNVAAGASAMGGQGSSGGGGALNNYAPGGAGGCGQLVETWVPVSANVSITIGAAGTPSSGTAAKPGYCIVSWWV
jgi:hypothetical protein